MQSFDEHCARGIEPDRARIDELVQRSLMLVTALNPHIGYDKAAKIAKEAHQQRHAPCARRRSPRAGSRAEQFDAWVVAERDGRQAMSSPAKPPRSEPGRAEAPGRRGGARLRRAGQHRSASAPARPSTTSSTRWRRCRGGDRRRGVEQRGEHGAAARASASRCSTRATVESLPVYIDGADEIDATGCMIKGGGGGADAREDRRRPGRALRLHRRRLEAGRTARPLSAAGGGDPDGGGAGRRAASPAMGGRPVPARRRRHRQRRPHPRRPRPGDRRSGRRWRPRSTSGRASSAVGIFARNRASVCLLGTAEGVRTLTFLTPRGRLRKSA